MAVRVSEEVYEGLERVRSEGHTNMLDRPAVQRLAHENGSHETVLWIEQNKVLYSRGIFSGFEPERKEERA